LDYKIDPLKGIRIRIGDRGVTVTRLALIGNADINGHIIQVHSSDGLIDENTPIYVERMIEGTVIVRRFNQ
ncbi:NfeD family protein, partial [uncultured Phocaeicola sp.]